MNAPTRITVLAALILSGIPGAWAQSQSDSLPEPTDSIAVTDSGAGPDSLLPSDRAVGSIADSTADSVAFPAPPSEAAGGAPHEAAQSPDSADTLARAALRDSILGEKASLAEEYSRYAAAVDSAFSPTEIYPFHIFGADASGLSDIARFHPALVAIPFSPASSLSRLLYFGLPSPHVRLQPSDEAADFYPDAAVGTDIVGAAEMLHATLLPGGTLHYSQQVPHIVNPHVLMLWENGVFDENALAVRFARPLGRRVYLGVSSNYRYLERGSYSHTTGDIYNFYAQFVQDTSLIVHRGTNPLTQEHVTAGRVAWYGKEDACVEANYTYMDLHNDIAYEHADSLGTDLWWKERSQYTHRLGASAANLRAGMMGFTTRAFVQNDVSRMDAVTDSVGRSPRQRGERFGYGAAGEPFAVLGRDTTRVGYRFCRDDKVRFDHSKWTVVRHRATLAHTHPYVLGRVAGDISGSAGYSALIVKDSLEHTLLWKASVSAALGHQHLSVFVMQDYMPPEIPYDTALGVASGSIVDSILERYQLYGAHCQLSYKRLGLFLGGILTGDIDPYKARYYWPEGVMPYAPPKRTVVVAPLFGRWHGLATSSSWMFADEKPYVKSHSTVSYYSPGARHRQRLFVDVAFDFWSERERITLGGIDTWNRPIYDLNMKIAVQIKTFRLFYKIGNILDRKNAYVPGYFLPGLTFRWGFNWLLQG